ncbi:MAG: hypothetical protein JSW11_22240 [Candidatus Heimdallarchaeota archaeon]|nr:MAG: hypothetical protein JSW11_22240 [Candidatus Heimdallarchaeota archaeon]
MEASGISEQNDHEARYKALGKKLKQLEDDTANEVQEKLIKGVKKISSPTHLPKDLATYLLSLKREIQLPVSVLPLSLFKRPTFFGREDFFHRLASELIAFGIAYQRVYLQPIKLSQLAVRFHEHRPWWQCDIEDIEKALEILKKNKIIQKTPDGFLFEPLSMSSDAQDFLSFISRGINKNGEISLTSIQNLVPWNKSKIDSMVKILCSNQICLLDQDKESLFFPELKTR